MKYYLSITLVFILFVFNSAFAEEKQEYADSAHLFLKANEAFHNSDFEMAVSYYDKILSNGVVNGEIFYNLGNAYLKTGDMGSAILNYRKAEKFIPRDEDLQANLKYAHELTRDNVECKELISFLKNFCFWYSKLNIYELLYLFLAVNFLLWSFLAARLFYKEEALKILLYANIFLLFVVGPSFGLKFYNHYFVKTGVVTSKEIRVRSGSTVNGTVLFKLHDGAEFEWVQEIEGWVKIRLCDGKKGWVQRKLVDCVMW